MTDAEVISRPRRFRHYHYYVAGNIVGRMVNKIAPELVQDKDHETIGRAAAYLLRQLNPNEEMRSLTKELLYGFKKGYGGNITNIEKDLSKEISWNELSNIIRKTDRIRPDLKRRLKNELGTEAGTQRVRELAKLY
ncbi:MAG: hypothetical protein M1308_11570 [Actinobacteria bacterium]|nr:hypothetical protein [Actinomycetota bacterium]